MSKLRSVNTRFWDDNYILDCDPLEKLLYLYLITNSMTNMLGIYEISLKRIGFDTGLDKEMVIKLLKRFENAGKAFYKDGYIVLMNYAKHQNYNNNMYKSAYDSFIELKDSLLCDSRIIEIAKFLSQEYKPFAKHLEPLPKGSEPLPKGSKPIGKYEVEYEVEIEDEYEDEYECDLKKENSSTTSSDSIFLKEEQSIKEQVRKYRSNRPRKIQECKDRYLKDQIIVDQICKSFSLDKLLLEDWLDEFISDRIIKGETQKSYKDFQSHFANWLKFQDLDIHPRERLSQSKQNKQAPSKSKKNGADILAEKLMRQMEQNNSYA